MKKSMNIALSLALVFGGGWVLSQPVNPSDPLPGAAQAQETDMADADQFEIVEMVEGNPDAAVEVIEYASFTCPHCANFQANQYQELKANYIDTGKIRFVLREVYFDRPGLWASMVARCGGEMRFFGISDMLFERQQDWARGETGQEIVNSLRQIGKTAGLDDETLDACLSDAGMAQALVGWYQENADRDGIQGTPSFMINGELYTNMNYEEFAAILDEKLAEADAADMSDEADTADAASE